MAVETSDILSATGRLFHQTVSMHWLQGECGRGRTECRDLGEGTVWPSSGEGVNKQKNDDQSLCWLGRGSREPGLQSAVSLAKGFEGVSREWFKVHAEGLEWRMDCGSGPRTLFAG